MTAEPIQAVTRVIVDAINAACTVQARLNCTFINVDMTVPPSKSWTTKALIVIDAVLAPCSVQAGHLGTVINVSSTGATCETWQALTHVLIEAINTLPVVFTGR